MGQGTCQIVTCRTTIRQQQVLTCTGNRYQSKDVRSVHLFSIQVLNPWGWTLKFSPDACHRCCKHVNTLSAAVSLPVLSVQRGLSAKVSIQHHQIFNLDRSTNVLKQFACVHLTDSENVLHVLNVLLCLNSCNSPIAQVESQHIFPRGPQKTPVTIPALKARGYRSWIL